MLTAMESRGEPDAPLPPLPPAKKDSQSKNKPKFTARAHLARIGGVDLVAVTGLAAAAVQSIIAESGTDMRRLPTVKHFCSWLGLAPHNDVSGGRVLRSRTLKVRQRAGQAFRQAAQAVLPLSVVDNSNRPFKPDFRQLLRQSGTNDFQHSIHAARPNLC